MVLVGEHRISGQALLLGTLDLAVPVRSLHQPHHEAQAMGPGNARHFAHHLERAGLVGLHGQAEAAPCREVPGDARGQCLQHIEREFQPITLFGVDGQVDVGARRRLDQAPHARQQLGEHALALRVLVAREEGTQL